MFVVHGDLLDIAADAVLVPTDRSAHVNGHWARFVPAADDRQTLREELASAHVSECRRVSSQVVRYVDTGAVPSGARADWLRDRVSAGVRAIVGDVVGTGPANRRARPLVLMPIFGTGAGGFDAIRGEAIDAVLTAVREVIDTEDCDAAIVGYDRADFTAVQSRRRPDTFRLSPDLRAAAEAIASDVASGRTVLFLGAGVSMAAGLPSFERLITALEEQAGITAGDSLELPDRAEQLAGVWSEQELEARVRSRVPSERYALAHGLLAGLRVREAITTNFDSLYELAAQRPFGPDSLQVLPQERSSTSSPWLLKAHGDVVGKRGLVLTARSFNAFETESGPVAGVVRAMFALSRDVLFVGYSLEDRNIRTLMDEASAFHHSVGARHRRLGTVFDIESPDMSTDEQLVRIGLRERRDEPLPVSARRLEILLDYVSWSVTRNEQSWLLDRRYAGLLDDRDQSTAQQFRDVIDQASGEWDVIKRVLARYGYRSGR